MLETGPGLRALMSREITPAQALESGRVRIQGDPAWLDRFVEVFHVGPPPV